MNEEPARRRINRILVDGGFLLLLGGLLYLLLWLEGSIVVIDETGEVVEAVASSDPQPEQPLYRLSGGIFYAIPRQDGVVEIRCRNGARKQGSYVSVGIHLRVRVVGDVPCGQIVETY